MSHNAGKEVHILVAEENEERLSLLCDNLKRAGISNTLQTFNQSGKLLDFLMTIPDSAEKEEEKPYLLLLSLDWRESNGVEILRRIKENKKPVKIRVIVVADTTDSGCIEECRRMGYDNFVDTSAVNERLMEGLKKAGFYLMIVEIPTIKWETAASG